MPMALLSLICLSCLFRYTQLVQRYNKISHHLNERFYLLHAFPSPRHLNRNSGHYTPHEVTTKTVSDAEWRMNLWRSKFHGIFIRGVQSGSKSLSRGDE